MEFVMKDITAIYAANKANGMLTLTLGMQIEPDPNPKTSKNLNRVIAP